MLISERIYEYMKTKGISQMEFSKRTGISQSTISDWHRKGTNPSADKIMIICDVLEISPYDLLLDTKNEKMKPYNPPECLIINKDSDEFFLIETYRNLSPNAQKWLAAYLKAFESMNDEK